MQQKIEAHERFWRGDGPSLILIPAGQAPGYDMAHYPAWFRDPQAMWESEMCRADPLVDWPTDGIPTVRPNLGVIFVPTMGGLEYSLREGQMPWPGAPLGRDAIRAARHVNLAETELMRLAEEFYAIHRERGRDAIAAYHADTQGIFDIAHLLYGDEIFYELPDEDQAAWVAELLEISLGLYLGASRHLKKLLGQDAGSMVHGHGTPQGVYFPHAGVRMCEDTPTLLSPEMIERFILPLMEQAAKPFGGAFVHYCGRHDPLFERLCPLEWVRAIDLGNPEMYDTRWLLEQCAETGTVLFSQVAPEPGEQWEAYVRRVAGLVSETGARCILRAAVSPQARDECAAMRDLWHELTG